MAILAMTVGLIRSESAGDLRTLTATGATSRIRRTLTGTTAGALALLGVLLGVAGAYLALVATYLDDLDYLGRIPMLPLVLMAVGLPLVATAAGWLLAEHSAAETIAITRKRSRAAGTRSGGNSGRQNTDGPWMRDDIERERVVGAPW
jgi:uncharacterized membrane protein YbhN (UPF0104 family)